MKKLMALVLVTAMVLATGVAMAATGTGTQSTQLLMLDGRTIGWTWTVPAVLQTPNITAETPAVIEGNNYDYQSHWEAAVEIKDALIGVGKCVAIAVDVTKPLTNGAGNTLDTLVRYNLQYTPADADGVMRYKGNDTQSLKCGVTMIAQGAVDQIFVSNYDGSCEFTCSYADAPVAE